MTDTAVDADLTAARPGRGRALWARVRALDWTGRGRDAGQRARPWQLLAAVPGLIGAGLLAAAAGGIVYAAAGPRYGLWAGLAVAGLFLLRLDARL